MTWILNAIAWMSGLALACVGAWTHDKTALVVGLLLTVINTCVALLKIAEPE